MRRVNQHAAEHLQVDAPVERLDQTLVRQAQIGLEEHQRHLAFRREQRLVTLGGLGADVRIQLRGKFPQRQLLMDAAKLTQFKTLPIFFEKIVLCEAQTWAYVRNLS